MGSAELVAPAPISSKDPMLLQWPWDDGRRPQVGSAELVDLPSTSSNDPKLSQWPWCSTPPPSCATLVGERREWLISETISPQVARWYERETGNDVTELDTPKKETENGDDEAMLIGMSPLKMPGDRLPERKLELLLDQQKEFNEGIAMRRAHLESHAWHTHEARWLNTFANA